MVVQKLRLHYLKQCCELSPFIRIQDLEDIVHGKKHQLLKNLLGSKQQYKLLIHNKLLIYPIESQTLTEFRIDLDNVNLKANLETMFNIRTQLDKYKIKATYEHTGGKGLHIRFLINVDSIYLRTKFNDINLNDFEKEFRAGDKKGKNYKLISLMAFERLNLKKQLAVYLGLYNIIPRKDFDTGLLSSFYLLGCPGSVHRKTNKPKAYLDLNKLTCVDEVLTFIATNKTSYINFEFLKNVWRIPAEFKYNSNIKNVLTERPKKNNTISVISSIKHIQHVKQDIVLNTLKHLYLNSDYNTYNSFSFYVVNVCHSFNFNLSEIKSLYVKLFELLNVGDNDLISDSNIQSIYKYIETNFNIAKLSYNFKSNWSHNDFMTTFRKNNEVSQ